MIEASVNDPCECGQTTIRGCADMPSRHCGATEEAAQPVTDIDEIIAEMRAGLEGVTPGDWSTQPHHIGRDVSNEEFWIKSNAPILTGVAWHVRPADATHITRCSPANIASLLDEIERLRADNTRLRKDLLEATALVTRYRKETPLGNQPHMIAHVADDFIARSSTAMEASNGK
jgi:hypothetical protein